MLKKILPYSAIALFGLFSLFVYIVKPGSPRIFTILTNVVAVGAAAIAFFGAVVVNRRPDVQVREGWLLITIGLGLFLLGEISWSVQEAALGIENPFPSIADLFWVAGYLPIFLGLIITLGKFKTGLRFSEAVLIWTGAAALFAIAGVWLLVPIALAPLPILEKTLEITYPVADIFLVVPAVVLALVLGRTMLSGPWILICVGLILLGVADFCFSYLTWHELYWASMDDATNFMDLLWVFGYLAIGVGSFQYRNLLEGLARSSQT